MVAAESLCSMELSVRSLTRLRARSNSAFVGPSSIIRLSSANTLLIPEEISLP